MLPKDYRLKKKSAFLATYKSGKVLHEKGITLFLGKEKSNDNSTKIGFVVSKKIHKRAVQRNRIKRLLRESCRLIIKNESLSTKYLSLVFVVNNKILGKNFGYVDSVIHNLVDKL